MEPMSLIQIGRMFLMILFGTSVLVCDRPLDFKCDSFETYESRLLAIQPYAIFNDSMRVYHQCCNLCAAFDKCASFNYDLKTHLCSLLPQASEEAKLTQSLSSIHGKFIRKDEQSVKGKCRSRPCQPDHLCLTSASGPGHSCLKGPRCSDAPPVDHMTTHMGLITLTSGQANYTCDTGFQRETGSGHSTCTVDKGWTKPSLVCKGVDCGHPPAHDNKKVTFVNSTLYQARVKYTCDPGYNRTEGNQSSFCQADGTWSVATLKCQAVDCGIPTDVEHMEMRLVNWTTYMSQVIFTCSMGFNSDGGNPAIECLANGTWSQPALVCKRVDCGHPPAHGNKKVTSLNSTLYQACVEYICDSGYNRTEGNQSSSCQANGTWSVPTLKCQAVDCGIPTDVKHMKKTVVNGTTYMSQVIFTCIKGFNSDGGNPAIECLANGTWSQPALVCKPVDCGIPTDVEHMEKTVVNGTTYMSQVIFTCITGFNCDGGNPAIECLANGTWSQPALVCKRVDCGHPPAHGNKKVISVNSTLYQARVEYICDSGYNRTEGNQSSSCQANGTWSVPTLKCHAVDCGIPRDVEHMEKKVVDGTTYMSQVIFTCITGFNSDGGNPAIECLANGTWSQSALVCKRVDCGHPPAHENKNVASVNSTLYQARAEYICDLGYNRTEGNDSISCQANGTWSVPTLKCQAVDCEMPADVERMEKRVVNGTTYMSQVTVTCSTGFTSDDGDQTIECLANGTWSQPTLDCKRTKTQQPSRVSDEAVCRNAYSPKMYLDSTSICEDTEILTGCSSQKSTQWRSTHGSWIQKKPIACTSTGSQSIARCCKIPGLQCEYIASMRGASSVSCDKNMQLLDCTCLANGGNCFRRMTNSTCKREFKRGRLVELHAVCCSLDQLSCYVKEVPGPPRGTLQIKCEPGETMTACSGFHRGKGTPQAKIEGFHGVDTCMIPRSGGSYPHLTGYVSCCKYEN